MKVRDTDALVDARLLPDGNTKMVAISTLEGIQCNYRILLSLISSKLLLFPSNLHNPL